MSAASILNDVSVPWPDADTGQARAAAAAWAAIASAAQDALGTAGQAAYALSSHNTGPAMDSFNTYWGGIGGPFEACPVVEKPAMLLTLMQAATALSTACSNFADAVDAVDAAKHKLEETAEEIAAAIAAGILATAFTAGISDTTSVLVTAQLAAVGIGTIEVLGTTIGDIVAAMSVGGIFGTLDAVLEGELTTGIKAVSGEDTPSVKEQGSDLVKSLLVGVVTAGLGTLASQAAGQAALVAMENLPDGLDELFPDLHDILAGLPTGLETPTIKALKTLAGEYASKGLIGLAHGRGPDAPSLPEVLGELLNARIEGSSENEGGGEE